MKSFSIMKRFAIVMIAGCLIFSCNKKETATPQVNDNGIGNLKLTSSILSSMTIGDKRVYLDSI